MMLVRSGSGSQRTAVQSLAADVLNHVAAAAVRPVSRRQRVHDGSQALEPYITLLPCPPAPAAWWQLCSDVSAGGSAAFKRHTRGTRCKVPDIQGSAGARCQLARRPYAHKFNDPLLAAYAAALFTSLVAGRSVAARRLGAPAPELNRWDMWHGHCFLAHPAVSRDGSSSGRRRLRVQQGKSSHNGTHSWPPPRLGILFHAAEYPAFDAERFPIYLGCCQHNSSCVYHPRAMDLRNMLWYQGKLAVLDVGQHSPLHGLLHPGTEPLRTVYEEDFGSPRADLLLLQEHPPRRRRSLAAARRLQQRRWREVLASGGALAVGAASSGVFVSL